MKPTRGPTRPLSPADPAALLPPPADAGAEPPTVRARPSSQEIAQPNRHHRPIRAVVGPRTRPLQAPPDIAAHDTDPTPRGAKALAPESAPAPKADDPPRRPLPPTDIMPLPEVVAAAAQAAIAQAPPPANDAADLEGVRRTFAGRFEILRRLGRGGMGSVYAARQVGTARSFALKVLRGGGNTKDADRFQREMDLTSRIAHPNVVRIYDFGRTDDGHLFYTMELIEGSTLHELIHTQRNLPLDRALRIMHHVALGLAAAHQRGIIHRDVKPENIMISHPAGWPDFARLVDFGIARETRTWEPGQQPLTSRGVFLGTPRYASPEAIMADPLTPAADIYSFGCVVFQLLSGRGPFDDPNPIAMMERHLRDPAPSIASLSRVVLPPELATFIDRMLRKVAAERPESMELVAATFRRWLDILENRNLPREDMASPVMMRARTPSLDAVLAPVVPVTPEPAGRVSDAPIRRPTHIPGDAVAGRQAAVAVPDAASVARPADPSQRWLVAGLVAMSLVAAISLVLHL
jgi:hypothetical protein